jgi:hypothetical protein
VGVGFANPGNACAERRVITHTPVPLPQREPAYAIERFGF